MFDKVSISLNGSIVLLICLVIVLIGLSILFYRYTIPPLPFSRRVLLSVLRSLSVSLIALVLFEPIVRFVDTEIFPPKVAILVDNSQSMNIKDIRQSRAEAVIKILRDKIITRTLSKAQPIYYKFSSILSSLDLNSIDTNSFTGEATDLSKVLGELNEKLQQENIQAVVLLTDGNFNIGKNPIYNAENSAIPFYTIGVGDTNERKDILIDKVITNNITFAESRLPIDVIIRNIGYDNVNAEVQLVENSKSIEQAKINLKNDVRDYPLRFYIEPKEEGIKKYTIKVSEFDGELTNKNNFKSVTVKVLKSKLQVVLLSGAPSPDVPAVRQALIEDKQITLKSFVEKRTNEFYERNVSRSDLDSADCFIFIGFPSDLTSGNIINQLKEIIDAKKKPILFINSKTTNYNKLQYFESILPISWSNISSTEIFVYPIVSERQKFHPLITLENNITIEDWQQLPPIYKTQTIFKSKPESDVLAFVKIQNVPLNEPLISIRNIGKQKSLAITGNGLWRWQLLTQGTSRIDRLLSLFITNSIRWLTTIEDEKNVRVTASKEYFSTLEPIVFTAQVYDEQLRPVDNAEVTIEVTKGKDNFRVILNALGNGRYEGTIDGLTEGDYAFNGRASLDGKIFGEDKGKFFVGSTNLEYFETKMNKSFLEQLSYRTGGKYFDVNDAHKVAEEMEKEVNFSSKELVHSKDVELWNWKYFAAIIILILGVEWFIRKRSGMS